MSSLLVPSCPGRGSDALSEGLIHSVSVIIFSIVILHRLGVRWLGGTAAEVGVGVGLGRQWAQCNQERSGGAF